MFLITVFFSIACRNGHVDIVEYLLKRSAKYNLKDSNRMSALHHAVLANSLEIIEILAKKKIDMNAQNFEDMTPIK